MTAPRKLTPETQRLLVEAIDKGLRTKLDICALAGIRPCTLNQWEKLAAAGDEQAQALFAALDLAKARRKQRYLRRMQRAGRDDWKMWREMLALADPEEYGKQPALPVELSGRLQTEDVTLDDDERAARIAELLDRGRARRAGQAADAAGEGEAVGGAGAGESTAATG